MVAVNQMSPNCVPPVCMKSPAATFVNGLYTLKWHNDLGR